MKKIKYADLMEMKIYTLDECYKKCSEEKKKIYMYWLDYYYHNTKQLICYGIKSFSKFYVTIMCVYINDGMFVDIIKPSGKETIKVIDIE